MRIYSFLFKNQPLLIIALLCVGLSTAPKSFAHPMSCDWVAGQDLLASNKVAPKYLSEITQRHWYLGASLQSEIARLRFCMTKHPIGELSHVRVEDHVVLNKKSWQALSPSDRARVLIEEGLQAYLPAKLKNRSTKLKNLVRNIEHAAQGKQGAATLSLQLSMNELDMPTAQALDKLSPSRDKIQQVIDSSLAMEQRLAVALDLSQSQNIKTQLSRRDVKRIRLLLGENHCGLSGTLEQRRNNCAFMTDTPLEIGSLELVYASGADSIIHDPATGLLWSVDGQFTNANSAQISCIRFQDRVQKFVGKASFKALEDQKDPYSMLSLAEAHGLKHLKGWAGCVALASEL